MSFISKKKLNHTIFSNNLYFSTILIFISISFLIFRILIDTPKISLGLDEPVKWMMAVELSHFKFSGFGMEANTLHHQLRWGSWIFAYFFQKLFGLGLINYYLSSYIPAILGILIFSFLIVRYLNNFCLLTFFIFIILDVTIYKYTIQLLPTSPGILGLALFVYFGQLYLTENKKNKSNCFLICLTIVCFYLYGVKITNVIFSLLVFFLIYKKERSVSKILFILSSFLFLYICETIFFQNLGDYSDLKYGRIYALINSKDVLLNNWYQAYFSQFFLKGIFLRLYEDIRPELTVIYFSSLVISFHYFSNYNPQKKTKQDYLLFLLSATFLFFVVFNIFFITSFDPITPAQIYLNRYFVFINPLAYFIIIFSLSKYFKNFNILQGIFVVIFTLVFFSSSSNYFWNNSKKNERKNIVERIEQYNEIKNAYINAECVRSKHHPLVKWLPQILVQTSKDREFFQNFRFNKIIYSDNEKFKTVKIGQNCNDILNIDSLYKINK